MNRAILFILVIASSVRIGTGSVSACEYVDPQEDEDGYRAWCRCIGGTPYTAPYGGPACIPPSGGGGSGSLPPGAVKCGSGYCGDGFYCGRNNRCIPNNEVDCGSYTCDQGNYCGKNDRCIPAGKIDCGDYICDSGNSCGRSSRYCVPYDKIDCGDFVCPQSDECGPNKTCPPIGTAKRHACLDQNNAQLRALNSDIELLAYHIGNATDSASAVQRELEGWIVKNEEARQEAMATAAESFSHVVISQGLWVTGGWHHSPPDAGRLKRIVTNFLRIPGIAYRKLEMKNPRFLKYAIATAKGVRAEHKLRYPSSLRDYIDGIGGLTEALIDLAGPLGKPLEYPKHLIAIGVADVDIWSDDFYAYWVAVMTVYHSKKNAEIRDSELRDMAMWSRMLKADADKKKELATDREWCPKVGG